MPQVEGVQLEKMTISRTCRDNRGNMSAFNVAVERLRAVYLTMMPNWDFTDAKFHLVLTLERPKREPAQDSRPLTQCASQRDGDCIHALCPQLRDKEPETSGRTCPLPNPDDNNM